MATLSGYDITTDTLPEVDSGRRTGVAEGGQIRGRNTYEQPVYTIPFVVVTDAVGAAALESFYDSYSDTWNDTVVDGATYTWLFANKPTVTQKDGPVRIVSWPALGYKA